MDAAETVLRPKKRKLQRPAAGTNVSRAILSAAKRFAKACDKAATAAVNSLANPKARVGRVRSVQQKEQKLAATKDVVGNTCAVQASTEQLESNAHDD